MNNKGMTTIELITSFVLASIVFILLFNVVLSLKDVYITNKLTTKLLINQANLSRSLNKEINSHKEIISITKVNDEYVFTYSDGVVKTLSISEEEIVFDNYTYTFDNDTKLEILDNYVSIKPLTNSNLLIIDLPISNTSLEGNYGTKVVYQYDSNLVNVSLE